MWLGIQCGQSEPQVRAYTRVVEIYLKHTLDSPQTMPNSVAMNT